MTALLFVLLIQLPPNCPCLQVAAGSNLAPFEHVAIELYATVESQSPNEGIYAVIDVWYWPDGIAVVLLDREPLAPDLFRFYIYGVVPIGPKRVIFNDGFEAGLSAWTVVNTL